MSTDADNRLLEQAAYSTALINNSSTLEAPKYNHVTRQLGRSTGTIAKKYQEALTTPSGRGYLHVFTPANRHNSSQAMPARLTTYRPSPTTASFTVSNAPTRTTLSSKLTFSIQILLRILLFLSVILLNAAKARHNRTLSFSPSSAREHGSPSVLFGEEVWLSAIGGLACWVADGYSWQVITAGSVVVLYVVFRKGYTGSLDTFVFMFAGFFLFS